MGITTLDKWVDGNPSSINTIEVLNGASENIGSYLRPDYERPNFVAVLGHNMASLGCAFRAYYLKDNPNTGEWDYNGGHGQSPIINSVTGTHANNTDFGYPISDGFSIMKMTTASYNETYLKVLFQVGAPVEAVTGNNQVSPGGIVKIGTIMQGRYYDMPHSPDLSLTMSREYGGIKTIETKGGASLSNATYTKPAMWGDAGAWELYKGWQTGYPSDEWLTPNQAQSRSGRRIWNLSFSYLQDSDVFGTNQSLGSFVDNIGAGYSNSYVAKKIGHQPFASEDQAVDAGYDDAHVDTSGYFNENLLENESLFSVIHKTNGGQLPFIFQPNTITLTGGSQMVMPDNLALCKFDMNTFQFEQVANGIYNINLKIREVW